MSAPPSPQRNDEGHAVLESLILRVKQASHLRGEIAWVAVQKASYFLLQLAVLKCLTNLLPEEEFGQFGLILATLVLLGHVLLMPVLNSYLRIYHRSQEIGRGKELTARTIRYYALATGGVLVFALIGEWALSPRLGLAFPLLSSGGLFFLAYHWRLLGIQAENLKRRRRSVALQTVGCRLAELVATVGLVVWWQSSASAALLGSALPCLLFAVVFATFHFRSELTAKPTESRSDSSGDPTLGQSLLSFGIPYALVLIFTWVQGSLDRFIIAGELDTATVGRYIAAFQVCGIPFVLMWHFLEGLLVPIMYGRARKMGDAGQLWSAYRVFLAGVGVYFLVGILGLLLYLFWGPWLLVKLTSVEFALPRSVLVTLALVRFLQCLAILFDRAFAVSRSVRESLIIRGLSAVGTVPVVWYLIASYGLPGAAFGALLATGVHVAAQALAPGGLIKRFLLAYRRSLPESLTSSGPEAESNE